MLREKYSRWREGRGAGSSETLPSKGSPAAPAASTFAVPSGRAPGGKARGIIYMYIFSLVLIVGQVGLKWEE